MTAMLTLRARMRSLDSGRHDCKATIWRNNVLWRDDLRLFILNSNITAFPNRSFQDLVLCPCQLQLKIIPIHVPLSCHRSSGYRRGTSHPRRPSPASRLSSPSSRSAWTWIHGHWSQLLIHPRWHLEHFTAPMANDCRCSKCEIRLAAQRILSLLPRCVPTRFPFFGMAPASIMMNDSSAPRTAAR